MENRTNIKILAPLNNESNVQKLITVGATEFYMGFYDNKHPHLDIIGSRHGGDLANINSISIIKKFLSIIKANNCKSYLTVNSKYYKKEDRKVILTYLTKLADFGLDGVIIADFNLLFEIKHRFKKLRIISSCSFMPVFNSNTIKFLKNIGVNRIILPRGLAIKEIKQLFKDHPEMEFEVFIKNDDCPNVDSLCWYSHSIINNNAPCGGFCGNILQTETKLYNKYKYDKLACGACSIFYFRKFNNCILKIVGRPESFKKIQSDVKFIKQALELTAKTSSYASYNSQVRSLYKDTFTSTCPQRCYYTN
jgi:collagenase-like PrtC family protease